MNGEPSGVQTVAKAVPEGGTFELVGDPLNVYQRSKVSDDMVVPPNHVWVQHLNDGALFPMQGSAAVVRVAYEYKPVN